MTMAAAGHQHHHHPHHRRPPFEESNDFEWDADGMKDVSKPKKDDSKGDQEVIPYDRRELRRRLSLDSDTEDSASSQFSARVRRSNLRERLQQKMNLQICFVNDGDAKDGADDDGANQPEGNGDALMSSLDSTSYESLGKSMTSDTSKSSEVASNEPEESHDSLTSTILSKINFKPLFSLPVFSSLNNSSATNPSTKDQPTFATFHNYLRHIHSEAKKALKSAKEMAQMQIQLERQQRKASRILGLSDSMTSTTEVTHPSNQTPSEHTKEYLKNTSLKRLKQVVKQIESRTEELNVLLVKLLEERDDLQIEQDSLLIDIEDLTRYLSSQTL